MLIFKIFCLVNILILCFIIFCGVKSAIVKHKGNTKLAEKWGAIGTRSFASWITGLFLIWGIGFMYVCIMILDGQITLS